MLRLFPLALLWFTAVQGGSASSAAEERGRPPRAAPSPFRESVRRAFFPDARQLLNGNRPSAAAEPREPDRAGIRWSEVIRAASVEDEIKQLALDLAEDLRLEGRFRGGRFQTAREKLGLLAILLGVLAEFDGEIRWSHVGSGLATRSAVAADAAEQGTADAYRAAVAFHQDLTDLIRGGSLDVLSSRSVDWELVMDRPLLMTRMEQALEERVRPWLQDEPTWGRRRPGLRHEAELLATAAALLRLPGQTDASSADYAALCQQLATAAGDLARAAEQSDFAAAREAAARAAQTCSRCHEEYR